MLCYSKVASALARLHWVDISACKLIDMKGNPTTLELFDDSISGAIRIFEPYKDDLPETKPKER